MQLLLTGAVQGEDGHQGVLAVLLIMEVPSGEIIYRHEYSPPEDLVAPTQKIQFTGNCFKDGTFYVCLHNEILAYEEWPPKQFTRRLSIPGFNDLHHCMPWKDGIAVSNTGLETVDYVSTEGELIDRWDLLKNEKNVRTIDESKNYRLIPDTKPHVRHGNHLFVHDGDLWTSQLKTQNAVCVFDQSKSIEMEVGMPHDGTWLNDKVVFTTTNGHLIFFDMHNGFERSIVNLPAMTPDLEQLGWCRGVCAHPENKDQYFVGFSALRRSKWKDFGYWIKYGHNMPKSHISLYDVAKNERVATWQIGEGVGYQLFQVDVLPKEFEV